MTSIFSSRSRLCLNRCLSLASQISHRQKHSELKIIRSRHKKITDESINNRDSFRKLPTKYLVSEHEEEAEALHHDDEDSSESKRSSPSISNLRKKSAILTQDVDRKTYTNENGLTWKVLGKKDYGFINLMVRLKGPRVEREKLNKILLEGKRLITEGLTSSLKLHSLFFVDPSILNELPLIRGEGELFRISQERMDAWSNMDHGPGIFAIMEKPDNDFIAERQSTVKIPLTVIFDGISDPGNFGGVIRTLAAVGCEKLIVLPGTCDAWQATVLRGGMGAHFFIPIHQYVDWEYVRSYLPEEFTVFLADNNSYEVTAEAESLKNPQSSGRQTSSIHLAFDSKRNRKVPIDNELVRPNQMYRTIQLPVVDLYRTDFTNLNHIALIIGGETKGLSTAAYQFAHKYDGVRCHVPMSNGMNSLNVATATGIIAYEIKRQIDYSPKISMDDEKHDSTRTFNDKT